jgi:hypothetical protein
MSHRPEVLCANNSGQRQLKQNAIYLAGQSLMHRAHFREKRIVRLLF